MELAYHRDVYQIKPMAGDTFFDLMDEKVRDVMSSRMSLAAAEAQPEVNSCTHPGAGAWQFGSNFDVALS